MLVGVSVLLLGMMSTSPAEQPTHPWGSEPLNSSSSSSAEPGMVHPGETYAILHLSSASACMRECEEDDRCGSWVSGSCVGMHPPFRKGICYLRFPGRGVAYHTLCSFYGGKVKGRAGELFF